QGDTFLAPRSQGASSGEEVFEQTTVCLAKGRWGLVVTRGKALETFGFVLVLDHDLIPFPLPKDLWWDLLCDRDRTHLEVLLKNPEKVLNPSTRHEEWVGLGVGDLATEVQGHLVELLEA